MVPVPPAVQVKVEVSVTELPAMACGRRGQALPLWPQAKIGAGWAARAASDRVEPLRGSADRT